MIIFVPLISRQFVCGLCGETCKPLGLWAALSGLICFSITGCGVILFSVTFLLEWVQWLLLPKVGFVLFYCMDCNNS